MIAEDGVLADTQADRRAVGRGRAVPGRRLSRSAAARWSEWNGRYRDDVRRFWRGDPGMAGALATRLCGSATSTSVGPLGPGHSINFVTCHDGFTLADLVTYNHKHNEANGEDNRDGSDENLRWNCGVEGPTDDPAVLALRRRQARNLLDADVRRPGRADAAGRRRVPAARSRATTTPGARTTRSAGSTGRATTKASCASSAS